MNQDCQHTDCQHTDCQHTIETLPWLLNGSLDAGERSSLLAHLSSCRDCRRELMETAEVAELFSQHIPSLALAEYAQGLPASEVDRERVERHLALCPSCRQELEWATPGQVLDFEEARAALRGAPRRRVSGAVGRAATWRRLAVAASVAFVLSSASLVLSWRDDVPAPSDLALNDASQELRGESDLAGVLFSDGFEPGSTDNWSVSPSSLPPITE